MPAVHANATMWSLGTAVASAEETKTTIPISRTPKQISEFGLKPGKYRPPAVKVAGFDPLDANHAASYQPTGCTNRKGKHWNERQPNDTAHAN
ncbi:hypothetical protein SCX11_10445, partial [Bifidobacterium longum]|uniref:hypothetical protein n=1 Tax=Bifidobacterium longum TaxID=216816 RepID=UPI00298D8485